MPSASQTFRNENGESDSTSLRIHRSASADPDVFRRCSWITASSRTANRSRRSGVSEVRAARRSKYCSGSSASGTETSNRGRTASAFLACMVLPKLEQPACRQRFMRCANEHAGSCNERGWFGRRNRTLRRTKMCAEVGLPDNILHERAGGCRKRKLWLPTRRERLLRKPGRARPSKVTRGCDARARGWPCGIAVR